MKMFRTTPPSSLQFQPLCKDKRTPAIRAWNPAAVLLVFLAVIAAPAQTFTDLVNFQGTNGDHPEYGPLVQGLDGNFYGTTVIGGNGEGTIFQVTPQGQLTDLYI